MKVGKLTVVNTSHVPQPNRSVPNTSRASGSVSGMLNKRPAGCAMFPRIHHHMCLVSYLLLCVFMCVRMYDYEPGIDMQQSGGERGRGLQGQMPLGELEGARGSEAG